MNWGFGALSEPAMNAGQRFALGVEINNGVYSLSPYTAANDIRDAINKSGYVDGLTVQWMAGYINPFYSIEGRARYGHARASDLRETLLAIIQNNGYVLDDAATKGTAETVNTPIGQPGSIGGGAITTDANGQSVYLGSAYNQQPTTSPLSLGVVDDLASALGVTPTQAAIVGALGV